MCFLQAQPHLRTWLVDILGKLRTTASGQFEARSHTAETGRDLPGRSWQFAAEEATHYAMREGSARTLSPTGEPPTTLGTLSLQRLQERSQWFFPECPPEKDQIVSITTGQLAREYEGTRGATGGKCGVPGFRDCRAPELIVLRVNPEPTNLCGRPCPGDQPLDLLRVATAARCTTGVAPDATGKIHITNDAWWIHGGHQHRRQAAHRIA
jgi:hypothetical protein